MSEIYPSVNNIDGNLDPTIDTSLPIENNTNKKESPTLNIVNNLVNIISSILKILPKNNYTQEDETTVFNCLYEIQNTLKIKNIPSNIEDSFINVKKLIEELPSSKVIHISGDLYTLNNCLITFNSKLRKPLSPSVEKTNLNDSPSPSPSIEQFNQTKSNNSLSIYQKILLYSFIICVLLYYFNH
jgi:hypothetical protein